MAVDYDVKQLEVETYAEILVKLLGSMDDQYHHELAPVLKDVACLMTRFSSLKVRHIPRMHNKLAHELAHYAIEMAVGHKMFLNPPPLLRLFMKVSWNK